LNDDDDDEDNDDMDIAVVVVDGDEDEDEVEKGGVLIALCLKALISCNKSLISSWSLSTFCFLLLLWLPCLSKAAATCGDSACLKWLRVR
jgi:hypothetical protein